LTGGIATGKSSVSEIFRESGFDIIDADMIVPLPNNWELEEVRRSPYPGKSFGRREVIMPLE